jgi:hypothetical protein
MLTKYEQENSPSEQSDCSPYCPDKVPYKAKSNPINTTEPVAERPSQEKEKSHVSPERLIYSKNTTFHPPSSVAILQSSLFGVSDC